MTLSHISCNLFQTRHAAPSVQVVLKQPIIATRNKYIFYYFFNINKYNKNVLLTCVSNIKSDASTFCILYSNSISLDSQDCANSLRKPMVFIIKWFIKAIRRFWWMGKIYINNQLTALLLFYLFKSSF